MAGALFFGTVISGLVMPQIPESPCPKIFEYKTQSVPGDTLVSVIGLITITDPPVETVLDLFIHLQLRAILPSKYVGLVELVEKSNVAATNSSTTQKMYRVRFPMFKPLPTIRLISVNSRVICTGPAVSGPVVTDIRLEHSLRPLPSTNHVTEPVDVSHGRSTDFPYNIDPGGECGRAIVTNPLVVGGRLLRNGEWPWLAAIFVLNPIGLEFHCSGTIITKVFILTVGHCMRHENTGTMKPSEVVVYLGKYNLQQWEESQSIIKEVVGIYIHPDFDPNKYTADIALLQLKTPTEYNTNIQPVCLWSQSSELELIVGQIGSGPCNGDSGGGLMLPVTRKNVTRWELRGIVSLSLLNTTTQSCDLSQFIVFTDTAKFLSWVYFVVNNSFQIV